MDLPEVFERASEASYRYRGQPEHLDRQHGTGKVRRKRPFWEENNDFALDTTVALL